MTSSGTPAGRSGLEGIRLVEIAGSVAVAYMAKLFADLGAEVTRVEGASDLVRDRPHEVHRWLNTNKRSVTGDARPFVETADIVVHGVGPDQLREQGLEYGVLAEHHPSLVVCSLTPFGLTGPYADYAGEEINIIHGSSWGFLSPAAATREDLPPLKAAGHHAMINVATVAATTALAAFDRAERTGQGEHIDFSMLAAAAKMTEGAPATASFLESDASRLGVKTVVPWGIFPCADGLMQIICVEQAQWEALVTLMGEPEWAQLEVFATNLDRQDNADLLVLYLREWTETQKVDDLYRAAQKARIPATPVSTMEQLDHNSQFEARGFFAESPDGTRLPGSGFQVDHDWWRLRRPAPSLGEHDEQEQAPPATAQSAPDDSPTNPARPLDGVRVCDFTWIWAGPFCTQYLAHLGADVIRLESPDHLCLFRRLPFNPEGTPLGPDTTGLFQLYSSDKRSVALDLAHDQAREIIIRLVAESDIVVDNFGVGTMAALGFGVEDLRRINPDVIVVSMTGYGQTGPFSEFMAYGPSGGAAAGLYAATGYEDGDAVETGVAVGDPCTGITGAWATVVALVARRRNGEVARVDVSMVEAVAATIGEVWMDYLTQNQSPGPSGNHDPQWAPHNCYPAAGDDQWVTIACTSANAWRALCEVVDPSLLEDDRFNTAAQRKNNEAALDKIMASWTAKTDRWEITRLLQAVGVAALPSLSPLDLWGGDPQLAAVGMLERPDHPATGTRVVPGIPWRLANGPNGLRRPAPLIGQHTDEVLSEVLAYSGAEIERLRGLGALK